MWEKTCHCYNLAISLLNMVLLILSQWEKNQALLRIDSPRKTTKSFHHVIQVIEEAKLRRNLKTGSCSRPHCLEGISLPELHTFPSSAAFPERGHWVSHSHGAYNIGSNQFQTHFLIELVKKYITFSRFQNSTPYLVASKLRLLVLDYSIPSRGGKKWRFMKNFHTKNCSKVSFWTLYGTSGHWQVTPRDKCMENNWSRPWQFTASVTHPNMLWIPNLYPFRNTLNEGIRPQL